MSDSYIKWNIRFLKLAKEVSTWSKDNSSQVGAVIVDSNNRVVSLGYNGMPRGVNDDISSRHERPEKYFWFEHAERNAIYQSRENIEGLTIYITHYPCPDCTRGIIQSGLKRVIIDKKNGLGSRFSQRLGEGVNVVIKMMGEANISYAEIDLN